MCNGNQIAKKVGVFCDTIDLSKYERDLFTSCVNEKLISFTQTTQLTSSLNREAKTIYIRKSMNMVKHLLEKPPPPEKVNIL